MAGGPTQTSFSVGVWSDGESNQYPLTSYEWRAWVNFTKFSLTTVESYSGPTVKFLLRRKLDKIEGLGCAIWLAFGF